MVARFDGGAQPKLLILSEAYSNHEAALRASLRAEYQVRDMRAETLSDLADLVGGLPPGCALWRAIGGPMAWSEESHKLAILDYRIQMLTWMQSEDGSKGRNRPKPPSNPKYAREKAATEDETQRKADAYRKRQRRS